MCAMGRTPLQPAQLRILDSRSSRAFDLQKAQLDFEGSSPMLELIENSVSRLYPAGTHLMAMCAPGRYPPDNAFVAAKSHPTPLGRRCAIFGSGHDSSIRPVRGRERGESRQQLSRLQSDFCIVGGVEQGHAVSAHDEVGIPPALHIAHALVL